MYRIGMDGGGTRTRLAVIEQGQECFRCETGGINYNSFSAEEIRSSLMHAFVEVRKQGFEPEACEGIGIGAAGVSNPEAAPFLTKVLRELGFLCPIVIVGDQEAALAGAVGQKPGILLIAGTGSICIAQDGTGGTYRSGGFGHIIDDAGSAYAVGRDILEAIVRGEDGRGKPTALKAAVYEMLGIENIGQLIAYVYDGARIKRDIAAVASCLTEELIRTDEAAAGIARKAAKEQALLVEAVLDAMFAPKDTVAKISGASGFKGPDSQQIPLFLEGGLILKNREVNCFFRELLEERRLPVYLAEKENGAAYGAASLV